jgi:acetyltransferase-like isoleucine patch superfamily enzyme
MFTKIIKKIRYQFLIQFSPVIIAGFKTKSKFLKNTRISNTTFIDYKDNLTIEENVFIGHYNFIEASNGITIQEGCQITNYITITSHSSHDSIRLYGKKYGSTANMIGYKKGSIFIGKYTFIGPHCTILPNTNIGKGCIVAAYSLVKGKFPDFSIIAGNPAKVVGDTRERDKPYLDKHPELKIMYEEWIK